MSQSLHEKENFPLTISSVNVTKSAEKPADLVTFTEEILNGKLRFLCCVLVVLLTQQINVACIYFFSLTLLSKKFCLLLMEMVTSNENGHMQLPKALLVLPSFKLHLVSSAFLSITRPVFRYQTTLQALTH